MSTLHLLVPSLTWPGISPHELYHDLSLPTLEIMRAKSSRIKEPPQAMESWLCQTFGVTKQQNWPVAPITLQAEESDEINTGKDYWLRVDPVHLRLEQNHILLADSQVFKLKMEESRLFTDTLNKHFAKDGLTFLPLDAKRWYIRGRQTPDLIMQPLSEVAGKNINNLLPTGSDSMTWHSLSNEIQMLLHEHPVNEARQVRNELVINGVWFWGGGTMPKVNTTIYNEICGDDPLSRALALASETTHAQLPPDADSWLQNRMSGNYLLVLDTLKNKVQYKDIYGWQESIRELEQNWLAPLCKALKRGQIDRLMLIDTNETNTIESTLTRVHLKKFWRRIKPLSGYAGL